MTAPTIPAPRSRYKAGKSGNFELNSWIFMRGSGLLLVVLAVWLVRRLEKDIRDLL